MILINSSPKNALKIFQPFLPVAVPIGIGYLMGAFREKNIPVHFIDEQVEENVVDLVAKYVRKMSKPYIFGFGVLTATFKSAILLSKRLKEIYPESIIVFGGIHPTALPEESLSYRHIDVVFRGEAEESLVKFYECIKNKKDFTHLDNISYRKDGEIIHNKTSFIEKDLDSYPPFPYELFNYSQYDIGLVLTSRGCPHNCIFCSNRITTGRRYRFRSVKSIIEDLDLLYNKFNKKFVIFADDNFLVNKVRIYELIQNIKSKGFHKKLTFNFQTRADNVDYKLLEDLYDIGCKSISFGIETSSDRIMKIIKKNETIAQCIAAVKMAKKIGYLVTATFIYGFPGETHQDRMSCLKLSKELKIDMVRFNNATPYPGTELYEIAKKENRLNIKGLYENFISVSTFIENPFKQIPFSYVPKGSTETQIRRDILISFFSFYLDFGRIKTIFTKPSQGGGWFSAGEDFLQFLRKIPALFLLGFIFLAKLCQLLYCIAITSRPLLFFKRLYKKKIEV